MLPTRSLPPAYRCSARFDLKGGLKLALLNLAGLGLLLGSGWLFTALLLRLRPREALPALAGGFSGWGMLLWLGWLVLTTVLMLVLHEALHGIFFWLFSRARPQFGFRGWYAFAAAPGWYFPRRQYLLIALAPLAGISLLCALALAFVPPILFVPTLLMAVFNASGAVGDLWVAVMLARRGRDCYALDLGDAVEFYEPEGA
jgi:hypothetical protein